MGEVYRATDTNLKRQVAIKVLPQAVATDPERLARFQREAEVLAALNHPNIAHIYGFERQAGTDGLVMELVEGPTLVDHIAKGPIALDQALSIAKQIAEALEAAHDAGIIHRDLKPANIKVRDDGTVKVLDFGLAKALEPASGVSGDVTASPTLTSPAVTGTGVILGTAAYMAPEQARGRVVDKRADIWAFGIVLSEMLTGRPPFRGEDVTEILASVVKEQPDLTSVPAKARTLVERCLVKDPKKRLRDIGDAWALLATGPDIPPQAKAGLSWPGWAAAAIVAVGWGVTLWAPWWTPPAQRSISRFQIPPAPRSTFTNMGVSPDGRLIVVTATGADGRSRLWVRSLEALEPRVLSGTEGGSFQGWSPDSRFVMFAADGKLKTIEVAGGPPQTVCDAATVIGASWNRNGVIAFGSLGPLMRVPATGGTPSPLTALDSSRQENRHLHPVFLPDGRFLYLRISGRSENTGLFVGSLDTKPEEQSLKPVLATPFFVRYVPSSDGELGHLLFLRDTTLMAQPFDPARLELSGTATPVAERIGSFANDPSLAVSDNGVLIYRTGGSQSNQLIWMDRQGKTQGAVTEPGTYLSLALSPDGTRVAFGQATPQKEGSNEGSDIWLTELSRGSSARFTFDPGFELAPIWSPDGNKVAFSTLRGMFQKSANGAGQSEALLEAPEPMITTDWSRDGRFLLYSKRTPKTKADLWALPVAGGTAGGDRKTFLFLATEFNEYLARFSPDTRWIAYTSDESGRPEIYVRPFPTPSGGGAQWLVSKGGGTQPRWRRDGKELFYVSPGNQMMAVNVTVSTSGGSRALQPGIPQPLFDMPPAPPALAENGLFTWDVSADGQRFLVPTPTAGDAGSPITVVLNWSEELKQRVPTR
jgi:Tol biopolymer transport system component